MDLTMADVFNTNLFRTTALTAAILGVPYVPNTLAMLDIFEEAGVSTTSVAVEKYGTTLAIIPSAPRGAPGTPMNEDKRSAVQITIPHLPARDALTPDQIQNVRRFGTAGQLMGVQEKLDEKLQRMSRSLDATLEYHRLGAISGLVLDADGSTLIDCYATFGIQVPADLQIPLSVQYDPNDPAKSGAIETFVTTQVYRKIRDTLGGVPFTGVIALCGDAFFDRLRNHPEVRQTYLNQQAANDLRGRNPLQAFVYANVMWVNYRGWGQVAIPANKCRFIPMGVPELFITRFGPADYFSAVNTTGLPKYMIAALDPTGQKRIDLEAQSNPLNICTRPEVLFTGVIG